jgi:hypothetical protein
MWNYGVTIMPLRIEVDFNTMATDEEGRVLINMYTQRHLAGTLQPGMRVVLDEGETEILEVEATLEFDARHGTWLGRPDWNTRRDLPL